MRQVVGFLISILALITHRTERGSVPIRHIQLPMTQRNRKQSEFNETTTLFSDLFLVFFRQLFSSNLRYFRHCDVSTATQVEKANQGWRRHL